MMAQAVDLHQRGRFVEAERIYRRILQAEPGHPDALHLLGLIAREAGNIDDAIRLVQKAIAASPETVSFRSNLAMLLEEAGRYPDCETAAREALRLEPRNGNALHCLANALRATDRYGEAADAYERAVRAIPDDALLWSNYGATLQTLGRHEDAILALRRALALSPGQPELYSNLGNAQLAAGHPDAALNSYREAIRVDPGFAASYTNLASALLQAGKAEEAEPVLRQCLEISPGNRRALAYLAAAANETGDRDTVEILLDFDELMVSRLVDVPEGHRDLEDFNRSLVEHVTAHGSLMWEPVTKTTRRGSQTGELLDDAPGPIAALEEIVRVAMAEYLAAIPTGSDHPYLSTAPDDWRLTFWATVLERDGHQAAHVHPTGWLSGVYYAAVPPSADSDADHAGWIEFGRPPEDFSLDRASPTRLIEPEPGRMLLFPSYFYHRTLPFRGVGRRVSIAFDLVPVSERQGAGRSVGSLSEAEVQAEAGRIDQLLRDGQFRQAWDRSERLENAAPENPAARHLAGRVAFQVGRLEAAVGHFAEACRLAPDMARYHADLGASLQQLGRPAEAVPALERAVELAPDVTEPLMRLGTIHSDRGDFGAAEEAYARVIRRDPKAGGAHYGLASLKTFTGEDPHIAQMESLLADPSLEPNNEATICFGLAKAMDQLDRLDEAMALYARANRLKREMTDFDMAAERVNVQRIAATFEPALFEKFSGSGDPSQLPVFVIGMPRSGTTLAEQILASHPRVHGAGEINDLWRVLGGLGRVLPPGSKQPEGIRDAPLEIWRDLGKRYIDRITMYSRDADRIIDKLPFNYTLAGIIRLMLPQSRIIHCVRDPRDTCVSCYMTSFQNDRGFTFDLAELGETYSLYWDLMCHWSTVLPGGMHEVRYESLVEDPEGQSRAMVEYLGLDWSEDCLSFFDNPRSVTTASMTQVRQPIYKSSIGRWRRYSDHLAPLLQGLGDISRYGTDED